MVAARAALLSEDGPTGTFMADVGEEYPGDARYGRGPVRGCLSRSQAGRAIVGRVAMSVAMSMAMSMTYPVNAYPGQPEPRGRVIAGVLA